MQENINYKMKVKNIMKDLVILKENNMNKKNIINLCIKIYKIFF
jgi:hypothetical protein